MRMSHFVCPVCNSELMLEGNIFRCRNNHCYDRARSGYVNLLMSQAKKVHGDDKTMLLARRNFLEKRYYKPLLDKLTEIIIRCVKNNDVLLDAGCGEGWYTDNIYRELKSRDYNVHVIGIDISKNAVELLAKRNKEIETAFASVYKMPVKSESCDIVLSVFAPVCAEEIKRVLKRDAVFIRVYPLERHLLSLKKLIYDNVVLNELPNRDIEGLKLAESHTVKNIINLGTNGDILNLFMMTPYYYRTSQSDKGKIAETDKLSTETEFGIDVYRRL